MRPATPGSSGTPISVTRASSVECVTAVISGVLHGLLLSDDNGTGASSKLDRQWMRTPWLRAYSTRAQLQHARARRRHLEHLLERDDRQLARVGHDARVGAEDARHVGVDLAHLGADRGGERDRGRVRAAAAERRHVAVRRDALEAGDEHDRVLLERAPRCGRRARRGCAPSCARCR